MFRKLISITPIIFFVIGCSDATSIDKNEIIEPTYTYLKCEDKDESWKDDSYNYFLKMYLDEREHWANLVLKIDSDSQRVFHNGPEYQWRATYSPEWDTSKIMSLDTDYYNVDSEIITINRESLNVTRGIYWDMERPGIERPVVSWEYGCEIMNEAESTNYEEMLVKSREDLLRTRKEKEEEQKKKNKI
tara:strand:+ start:216 stop:782 length:567 start_codon:yes stop_codon:yes gene_type:complete